jgi:SAM-dependent methyltransferase
VPTSEHWQIPQILDVVARERPRRVLDVGAGYGKFGYLVREYGGAERVDGIDVRPPRFAAYDRFIVGDVRSIDDLLPPDSTYDLALIVEVVEHLTKPEAFELLERLTRRARRVLVTTPLGFRSQDVDDMPYERHRSGWYPWDFSRRFRVHAVRVYPGVRSRYLRLPRMWQILALISAR